MTVVAGVGLAGCGDTGEDGNGGGGEGPGEGTPTDGEPGAGEDTPTEGEGEGEETETEGETEMAHVRAVHAVPDAPNVDIYVDGEPALEDVAFRTVSDYMELEAGDHDVRITPAGEDETVFEDQLTVEGGMAYSVVALGEMSDDSVRVGVAEDEVQVEGDGARFRAFHASPDAPNIDIVNQENDEALVEDLGFGEASEYADVDADTYTLEVRPTGEDEPVGQGELEFESGEVYNAFAMGYLDPESAESDEEFSIVVADSGSAGGGSMGEGEETMTEDGTETTPGDEEPTPSPTQQA